jgi:hypothetical protein
MDMTAIEVTPLTLNGLVDNNMEIQKILLEDIASVETNLNNESEKKVGKLLLLGLLMVGITLLVVKGSSGGYDFSGIGFGGGK